MTGTSAGADRRRSVVTRVLLVAWLTIVWCALWGQASVGNVVAGLVVAALVVLVFPPSAGRGARPRPVAIVRFGLSFGWALVVSNLTVAAQVLGPRRKLAEAIVAVPLRVRSPVIVSFVANAITLTPGTMTIDVWPAPPEVDEWDADGEPVPPAPVDPDGPVVLWVHCLAATDLDAVRAEGLRLEAMAAAAFGTPADRTAVLGPAPPWPPTSSGSFVAGGSSAPTSDERTADGEGDES